MGERRLAADIFDCEQPTHFSISHTSIQQLEGSVHRRERIFRIRECVAAMKTRDGKCLMGREEEERIHGGSCRLVS